ncbi:hypothetical protein B484DRAFT_410603 [Ochromonadaceae sp. CCMP2298]|nr:hypothetical protein B484DRAFT_410603 [Ochromonadaceae sp. CCMP2298]
MLRMLYILVKDYGVDSKEVLLHRSRMLTLMIRHAEMSMGMSYEKYLEDVDDELAPDVPPKADPSASTSASASASASTSTSTSASISPS